MKKGIPLRIVTGFLGSGKTTLINHLLSGMAGGRIGVIVNDFGPLGVDASRLAGASAGPGKPALAIRELNNGQIFCACLVGPFIEAVSSFAGSDLDALWVEASGLAKPAPLLDTMAEIVKKTGGGFDFLGMVCVVDASRFLVLSSVVNALEEQVAYSSFVVVNKTDLVSGAELERVVRAIRAINPACRIMTAANAVLPPGALDPDGPEQVIKPCDYGYSGWGERGRPVAFSLESETAVDEARLLGFLAEIAPQSFRIKGFIATDRGLRYVDCVGAAVALSAATPGLQVVAGLTVISAVGDTLRRRALSAWKDLTDRLPVGR